MLVNLLFYLRKDFVEHKASHDAGRDRTYVSGISLHQQHFLMRKPTYQLLVCFRQNGKLFSPHSWLRPRSKQTAVESNNGTCHCAGLKDEHPNPLFDWFEEIRDLLGRSAQVSRLRRVQWQIDILAAVFFTIPLCCSAQVSHEMGKC